jgi:hypothetical protein
MIGMSSKMNITTPPMAVVAPLPMPTPIRFTRGVTH